MTNIYYYASVDSNNFVNAVHSISTDNCSDENGDLDEDKAIEYLNNFHGYSRWIRTCRDGLIRYNYAGVGYYYYEEYDAFVPPKPEGDVLLNDSFNWTAVNLTNLIDSIEIQ